MVTTYELHPGDVYRSGVLVAPGIWSDQSDGTWLSLSRSPFVSQIGLGWLPPYVPGEGTGAYIKLWLRVAAGGEPLPVSVPVQADIVFQNPGGGGSAPFTDLIMHFDVPVTGGIDTISHTATESDFANMGFPIDEVLTRLTGGSGTSAGMRAIRLLVAQPPPSGASWGITVYEAWLELGIAEVPTGKPFRRVWPREHGRVWPPPRHQHGRRTAGGYL